MKGNFSVYLIDIILFIISALNFLFYWNYLNIYLISSSQTDTGSPSLIKISWFNWCDWYNFLPLYKDEDCRYTYLFWILTSICFLLIWLDFLAFELAENPGSLENLTKIDELVDHGNCWWLKRKIDPENSFPYFKTNIPSG